MFVWAENVSFPEYTHEMVHYRNALVKEVNFAFSNRYEKVNTDKVLNEELERFKDFREKTGNRIQKDSERNKVWLDMLLEIFRSSLDFAAADLFLKYFNIPNEAIATDLYFIMQEPGSEFRQLIDNEAFNTAFEFLQFFPVSEMLVEYENLLKTAVQKDNSSAVLFLLDYINDTPYDRLLKDSETQKLLEKEYDRAEKRKRIVQAHRLADVLKDSDGKKRVAALEAMMHNNLKEAINYLKEIRTIAELKATIKEFYANAMKKGVKNMDVEEFKTAYAYALYGKLGKNGDMQYIQEPSGKLFEYYVTKTGATEVEYYEADRYRNDCSEKFVQDVVAKKMLELIQNNDRAMAKHLKKRFRVEFEPGEYKTEDEIKKFYHTLTETYGVYETPKGEENLLTALDIVELFGFPAEEIEEVKLLLCKFYLMNKIFDGAKKYFIAGNKELNELAVKQINTFISTRDLAGAYGVLEAIPVRFSRSDHVERKKDVKMLTSSDDIPLKDLETSIIFNDIYELKSLSKSFYRHAFIQGLNSGADGIQFLADLNIPFKKRMDACCKIRLTHAIKRLIVEDKISADILHRSYEKYVHPDILDYISYLFKRIFGAC